jgi:hypothetical protein
MWLPIAGHDSGIGHWGQHRNGIEG